MSVTSPKYSLVSFNGDLEDVRLPAYRTFATAFQLKISIDSDVVYGESFEVSIWDVDMIAAIQIYGNAIPIGLWVKFIGGISFLPSSDPASSFPITVVYGFGLVTPGVYAEPEDFFKKCRDSGYYNCYSESFLHILCSLRHSLTNIPFDITDKTGNFINMTLTLYTAILKVVIDDTIDSDFNDLGILTNYECFRYSVRNTTIGQIYSNPFKREFSNEFITEVEYYNNEDCFDFVYTLPQNTNKIQLPIQCKKPKYPEQRKVYKKSDNSFKVLSAIIEKEYECSTAYFTDALHEKVAVMLAHDFVHFKNNIIDLDVTKKDEYDPQWQDLNVDMCPAKFKVSVPFVGRNSNCERRIC